MKNIFMILLAVFMACVPVVADADYPIETELFEWDTFTFDAPAGWEKSDSKYSFLYSFYYSNYDLASDISVYYSELNQKDNMTSNEIIEDEFTDEDRPADEYSGAIHYRYDEVETYYSGRYPICFGHCVQTEEYDDGEFVQTYYKIVFYDKEGYKVEISYHYYQDEPDDTILTYFKMVPENIILK